MNTDNREVLFRGFHECEDGIATIYIEGKALKGRWIEGFPVNMQHNDARLHIHSFIIPMGADMSYGTLLESVLVPVISSTMDQFTGMEDVNSKLIFGGSICRDNKGDLVQILWSGKHQWGVKILKSRSVLSTGLIFPIWEYDRCKENGYRTLEVIGTSFDAPEGSQWV